MKLENFLTESECEYIIDFTKKYDSIKSYGASKLEFFHIKDYSNFKFLEKKLNTINIINQPVFNINKYQKGFYFLPHADRGGINDPDRLRLKTVIINLSKNNTFSGGDLYISRKRVSGNQGDAFVMDASTIHEVKKVTEGIRYSIAIWATINNIDKKTKSLI